MTAKNLIKILKTVDPDMSIVIDNGTNLKAIRCVTICAADWIYLTEDWKVIEEHIIIRR